MTTTINGYVITLVYNQNGITANAMVKDSAGSYHHHRLYQGYDEETVLEMFAQDCDYLATF